MAKSGGSLFLLLDKLGLGIDKFGHISMQWGIAGNTRYESPL